ncbi:hypothetical protein [Shewanella sp. YLB-07]|uniref:hypothetical protein n=1 Tax=Shewanella sp. YLB-07 TaxID=2601268 RepID=UPI00128B3B55|nr:hypothetical protein [Shewanella sp. YLB-07]MPY23324.1 hypothetical protein [Shewanella sp. YLB-07]
MNNKMIKLEKPASITKKYSASNNESEFEQLLNMPERKPSSHNASSTYEGIKKATENDEADHKEGGEYLVSITIYSPPLQHELLNSISSNKNKSASIALVELCVDGPALNAKQPSALLDNGRIKQNADSPVSVDAKMNHLASIASKSLSSLMGRPELSVRVPPILLDSVCDRQAAISGDVKMNQLAAIAGNLRSSVMMPESDIKVQSTSVNNVHDRQAAISGNEKMNQLAAIAGNSHSSVMMSGPSTKVQSTSMNNVCDRQAAVSDDVKMNHLAAIAGNSHSSVMMPGAGIKVQSTSVNNVHDRQAAISGNEKMNQLAAIAGNSHSSVMTPEPSAKVPQTSLNNVYDQQAAASGNVKMNHLVAIAGNSRSSVMTPEPSAKVPPASENMLSSSVSQPQGAEIKSGISSKPENLVSTNMNQSSADQLVNFQKKVVYASPVSEMTSSSVSIGTDVLSEGKTLIPASSTSKGEAPLMTSIVGFGEATPASGIKMERLGLEGVKLTRIATINVSTVVQPVLSSQMFHYQLAPEFFTQYAEVNTYRVYFRNKYFFFQFVGHEVTDFLEEHYDRH